MFLVCLSVWVLNDVINCRSEKELVVFEPFRISHRLQVQISQQICALHGVLKSVNLYVLGTEVHNMSFNHIDRNRYMAHS